MENLWWRNLIGGADLILRLEGRDKRYHSTAIENDPEQIKEALKYYLRIFPQDAAYRDIRLKKDKGLVSKRLEIAPQGTQSLLRRNQFYRHQWQGDLTIT